MPDFVPSDEIRAAFSAAMATMYLTEVPLYGDLIEIVHETNAAVLDARPDLCAALQKAGDLDRLDTERHGAIRVGTATELSMLRRIFAVMGMHAVDYYDLSGAGVPVHSTAFRPLDPGALQANPFRVFTSLLRLDLIAVAALRDQAAAILAARQIVSSRATALLVQAERAGGLDRADAEEFVRETLEIFRWHGDAHVSLDTYEQLSHAHRLIADVVSFRGPHINHLTPRTLDIDAAHRAMSARGMATKAVIEGPPRRNVPILLRQTSFTALDEVIRCAGPHGEHRTTHTARFGEIEQRGIALTPAGRVLYDACLEAARSGDGAQAPDYETQLAEAFRRFPDDLDTLRTERLAFFRYALSAEGRTAAAAGELAQVDLRHSVDAGWVTAHPIIYEDFLPVSAAGIFQSNLGGAGQATCTAQSAQQAFEEALGAPVRDSFALYAEIERSSIAALQDITSSRQA